jgi:hypothetical protein
MKTHDHDHDGYGGEHPRWLPTVHRGYDPVLRRWDVPPPPWLWRIRPEPKRTKWDTIAGIAGGLILAAVAWVYVAWFF